MRKISTYVTHGRHYNCSVILLTQNYSDILPVIKKNTDIFIFFSLFKGLTGNIFFVITYKIILTIMKVLIDI